MITTAVIYARVSSVGDRQSTDRQISDLLDYVDYQKLELCKIFEEHISGAKKNTERPILQQAIEFCKSNDVSILAQENKHAVRFSRGWLTCFLLIFPYLLGTFGNFSYLCHR